MDIESPQVIEQQMEETRQSLTEKVSLLENQVVDTVKTTTQAVQDTVESVKSAVQDTVDAVKEKVQESVAAVKDSVQDSVSAVTDNVKETLDVKQHVERNPLVMVGCAAAAGLITGLLVFRKSERQAAVPAPIPYPPDFDDAPMRPASMPLASMPAAPAQPSRPGFIDELLSLAGVEAKQLAREAVDQASQAVRQHLMPALMTWVTQSIENAVPRPMGAESHPWQRDDRPSAARV